jgi:hypothetical protein
MAQLSELLPPDKLEALKKEPAEVQQGVINKYLPELKNESPEVQQGVYKKYGLALGTPAKEEPSTWNPMNWEWGKSAANLVTAIPKMAVGTMQDIATEAGFDVSGDTSDERTYSIRNPIKAIGGLMQAGVSGLTGIEPIPSQDYRQQGIATAKGVGQMIAHPVDTLAADPFGTALLASGGLGGASKLAKAAELSKTAQTLGVAKTAGKLSKAFEVASEAPGKAIAYPFKKAGELYEKALPATTGAGASAIDIAKNNPAEYEKLLGKGSYDRINAVNQQVNDIVLGHIKLDARMAEHADDLQDYLGYKYRLRHPTEPTGKGTMAERLDTTTAEGKKAAAAEIKRIRDTLTSNPVHGDYYKKLFNNYDTIESYGKRLAALEEEARLGVTPQLRQKTNTLFKELGDKILTDKDFKKMVAVEYNNARIGEMLSKKTTATETAGTVIDEVFDTLMSPKKLVKEVFKEEAEGIGEILKFVATEEDPLSKIGEGILIGLSELSDEGMEAKLVKQAGEQTVKAALEAAEARTKVRAATEAVKPTGPTLGPPKTPEEVGLPGKLEHAFDPVRRIRQTAAAELMSQKIPIWAKGTEPWKIYSVSGVGELILTLTHPGAAVGLTAASIPLISPTIANRILRAIRPTANKQLIKQIMTQYAGPSVKYGPAYTTEQEKTMGKPKQTSELKKQPGETYKQYAERLLSLMPAGGV